MLIMDFMINILMDFVMINIFMDFVFKVATVLF